MADPSKQAFLNTLFQWTVKNTTTGSETKSTGDDVNEMKDDDKKWLSEALENVTVNPIERLKLGISKVKDDQISEQQKREFLEELCHWAEELDLAKDFFTIGGLDILPLLLNHSDSGICMGACSLIANLVQNNDHCQRIVVQSGLQEKLLELVDKSTDPDLKIKAVTAISALIRGYTLGQLQLQKLQGVKILIRALSTPVPRLQNKLCFLINTICGSSAQMKKVFFENGALVELVRLANDPSCFDYTHVLKTIMTVSSAKTNSLITLAEQDPVLMEQFESILNRRREEILSSHEFAEEVDVINEMRNYIRASPATIDNSPSAPTMQQSLMLIS